MVRNGLGSGNDKASNRTIGRRRLLKGAAGVVGGIGVLGMGTVETASAEGQESLSVTSSADAPYYKMWVSDPNIDKDDSEYGSVTNHDDYSTLSGTIGGDEEHQYYFEDNGMLNTVDAVSVADAFGDKAVYINHETSGESISERFLKVMGQPEAGGHYEVHPSSGREPAAYGHREADEDFYGSTNPPDNPTRTTKKGSSWITGDVSENDMDLYEVYGDISYMQFSGNINALMSVNTPGGQIDFS